MTRANQFGNGQKTRSPCCYGSRDWDSRIRLFGPFLREKENPDLQGKDSNLCDQVKSTQNCLKFRKIGRLLAQFFFFIVVSAFLRVYLLGVNRNYCYGSFLWNLGIRIRKIRIGLKSFFLNRLKDSEILISKIRDS
jgi:hypothetical protein